MAVACVHLAADLFGMGVVQEPQSPAGDVGREREAVPLSHRRAGSTSGGGRHRHRGGRRRRGDTAARVRSSRPARQPAPARASITAGADARRTRPARGWLWPDPGPGQVQRERRAGHELMAGSRGYALRLTPASALSRAGLARIILRPQVQAEPSWPAYLGCAGTAGQPAPSVGQLPK